MRSLSPTLVQADPDGPSLRLRVFVTGLPGSGKTSLSLALTKHYDVTYLSSSRIAIDATGDHWLRTGHMAPEPHTSEAILAAIPPDGGFVLDGFPRSPIQLYRALQLPEFVPIAFLKVSNHNALRRLQQRGRFDRKVEEYRLREQSRLLAPVLGLAAVVLPTDSMRPEQVFRAFRRWFEEEVQPYEDR